MFGANYYYNYARRRGAGDDEITVQLLDRSVADCPGADRTARAGGGAVTAASDGPHDHAETPAGRPLHPPGKHAGQVLLRP